MHLTDKSHYCGSYLGLALACSVAVWAVLAIAYSYF